MLLFSPLIKFFYENRSRRKKEPGFPYVWINANGSVRECNAAEREHLNTKYEFGDGSKPSVKFYYGERNASGNIFGYLPRRCVPQEIEIGPAIEE